MTTNIIQITPFMHVTEIAPAVRFFTDVLGFSAPVEGPTYAYVEREGSGIRIQAHADLRELGTPHRGFAYYIDVKDVDAMRHELESRLSRLPAGDVIGPVDQPYGQRELMVRAPDGNLVVFGEALDARGP